MSVTEELTVGPAHTLVQNTVYALPARATLAAVTTSGGTVQVSNDASVWTSVTLTNGTFQAASVFIKSINADSIITCKNYTAADVTNNYFYASGAPGGNDTEVQFNDAGAFGGDSGLVFNKTTNALTLAGALVAGAITGSDLLLLTAGRVKSSTTDTQTAGLAVYDVNGTAYRDFLVWTNGNAPAVVMSIPTTGTLDITATSVQSAFKAADGTSGATAGPFTLITAIQVKNGLVTTLTGS
jgi:hypothetical protein